MVVLKFSRRCEAAWVAVALSLGFVNRNGISGEVEVEVSDADFGY